MSLLLLTAQQIQEIYGLHRNARIYGRRSSHSRKGRKDAQETNP